MKYRTIWLTLAVLLLLAFVASVAVGNRQKTNPPVLGEPQWDSPETRELAARACFDCHSNETRWPWYSNLPVARGLLVDHVREGRSNLNFSEWLPGREQEGGGEAAEKVYEPKHYAEDDLFPQPSYYAIHPGARLSEAEKDRLAQGLQASLGGGLEGDGNMGERDEEGESD